MFDPFQVLATFANVHVPEADVSELRARARDLRRMADSIDALVTTTARGVSDVLRANDSRAVERFAEVWPKELAPRYAMLQQGLRDIADACDQYADVVEKHRENLWIIGTQLAAMLFTMMFGYIYPAAGAWAKARFESLVSQAALQNTLFRKIAHSILSFTVGGRAVGSYFVREGLDAFADSAVWAVGKTAVHMTSSAASGQPMENPLWYGFKHFWAEMAYNGGSKAMSDVRKFLPQHQVLDTTLGSGPMGKFVRRTTSAALVYPLIATGELTWQGAMRTAMAHAPRAFILRR
ncbi:hypothetical protein Misp01_77890 [Microtetraspora sp. NBRC 13810]|uniref:WXG100-like domain-containing protein n=1 Tax=Microtetraspora sp. NBRC 13810 TaxID=3030990 RepID=UPI0024A3D842|nr:hypothetical protein [Microtetraspora sp. NBRC 13810]GLW12661.1 hypothetical protein Misp01_77890 [Microtetraspora sp. NBRC 13810]